MAWRSAQSYNSLISNLGLTTGLKMVLDVGDINSVPSSTDQTWLDATVNNVDWFRGTTSSSQTTDPAFNGTAGNLAAGTYYSVDGGDFFTLAVAVPAWMQNIHKNNALWTFMAFIFMGSGAGVSQYIHSNNAGTPSGIGFHFYKSSTDKINLQVQNGTATPALSAGMVATITTGTWYLLSVTIDEAAGTGSFGINKTFEAFTSTYVSPSASSINGTVRLLVNGAGTGGFWASTGRIGFAAFWEGVALTTAQIGQIYDGVVPLGRSRGIII